jgi:hypothetical protein
VPLSEPEECLSVVCETVETTTYRSLESSSLTTELENSNLERTSGMTASKAFAATALAFALAMPLGAIASPAFASTPNNSTKAVTVPADAKAVGIPLIFAKKDKEGEKEPREDRDKADREEKHHQIPPVVIRPKDHGPKKDGDKNPKFESGSHGDANHQDSQDAEDGESEDGEEFEDGEDVGDDDVGGFVIPGPSATPNPSSTSVSTDPSTGNNGASPIQPNNYDVSPIGTSTNAVTNQPAEDAATALNPEAAPVVNLASVRTSVKTPADVFMESATIALAALGIGALAMGGVASSRAIRIRRNPKGDYFYDGDN